jgi:hypothetical protein
MEAEAIRRAAFTSRSGTTRLRLSLPPLKLANAQTIADTQRLFTGMILPGDKVLFVGYPYGYSS